MPRAIRPALRGADLAARERRPELAERRPLAVRKRRPSRGGELLQALTQRHVPVGGAGPAPATPRAGGPSAAPGPGPGANDSGSPAEPSAATPPSPAPGSTP